MAELAVLGIRHHSPACARAVANTIERLRPRYVLIEGPCDMNDRLDELALAHELPIAIYSYRIDPKAAALAHGSWSPFCEYSPEWVALQRGREQGAKVLFIDLPAWHEAFDETENRYSDRHLLVSSRLSEVARDLGFDSVDTLWDHLFEHGGETVAVARDLDRYFAELRSDEPADERDAPREAFMAQWIAWAMDKCREAESVVVVCGGYHKPALERAWRSADKSAPTLAALPEDIRIGSYLVPFSYRRLDSFAGYASGMPSPAFYQMVWREGAQAGRQMLDRTARRLREKHQRVSTADLIAAHELAIGLARLRGHSEPLRADLLDGLAGALVKDALSAPEPWSFRGPLPRGTDPMLVEMVAAFCGETVGALAPETPRPPLVADVFACLERVGLELTEVPTELQIDPFDATGRARREVLHRLAFLGIAGVSLLSSADLRRGQRVGERWLLQRLLTTEPTLIERAVYGASLEAAASTRIEEALTKAAGADELVSLLERTLLAGLGDHVGHLALLAREAIEREPELGKLGRALQALRIMWRALGDDAAELAPLLTTAVERTVWVFEGIDGPHQAFSRAEVAAVAALRDCLGDEQLLDESSRDAVLAVLGRRARADSAPPALRGAALGAVWSLQAPANAAKALAPADLFGIADASLGDFLSGLFWLAREEFLASPLLAVVDQRLQSFTDHDFLVVLPSLRRSFAFFPPRERLAIAERLVRSGRVTGEARSLIAPAAPPELVQQAAAVDERLFSLLEHYGLHRS